MQIASIAKFDCFLDLSKPFVLSFYENTFYMLAYIDVNDVDAIIVMCMGQITVS